MDTAVASEVLSTTEIQIVNEVVDTYRPELTNMISGILGDVTIGMIGLFVLEMLKEAVMAVGEFLREKSNEIVIFAQENSVKFTIIATLIVAGLASGPASQGILSLVGFTDEGVRAASLAANWQSSIGNVAADSLFALLQSISATGAVNDIAGAIGIPAALTASSLVDFMMDTGKSAAEFATDNEYRYKDIKKAAMDVGSKVTAFAKENQHVLGKIQKVGENIGGAVKEMGAKAAEFAKDNENVLGEVQKVGQRVGEVVGNAANNQLQNIHRFMGWGT